MSKEKTSEKWKRIPIENIYLDLYDGPHATPKPSSEGPVFLGIKNITEDGKLDLSEIRHIAEEDFPKWTKRVVPRPGDIVFTYEATLNRYAIIPRSFRGCLGRRLALIRPNPDKINSRFLFYYFFGEDWRTTISKNMLSGSTVDRIPLISFPSFKISIPHLPTQHKIAAILSAYDDLIENNTRRIAILEEMVQTIYQEWFVHFRYPGYGKSKMVESELGMIPDGWNIAKFIDIADVLSGGTPRTANQEYWNGPIPFFAPRDAKSSFYILETEQHITEAGLKSCNSKLYPRDTVFITARGTVGKVLLNAADMAMNQSCYALRGRDGIGQYFVFMTIKNCVNQLKAQASGAVFDTITVDTFRMLQVLKPSTILIEDFSDFTDPMFKQILNLLKRNNILRSTRDLLLPKLISGEIDVEALDIDIPDIIEPEERQETPIMANPEPMDATQLALPLLQY